MKFQSTSHQFLQQLKGPYTTGYLFSHKQIDIYRSPTDLQLLFWRLKLHCHSRIDTGKSLPPKRHQFPCKSHGISGCSQQVFPMDQAVTTTGMLALTPLPLYQSKLNFPYSALGETISGCGRRVEHIAGCWETLGNKPCVLTKGLDYAKHFSYTSIASMLPGLKPEQCPWWRPFKSSKTNLKPLTGT